jgi:alpha-glucosidase (family GH31 glycosyl hydrolase)
VALKENIAMFTDPAKRSSTIPFLTNDLGGFDMGKTTKPEEELYIRWMQFSMFNPITEVFSQPENPTANLAWNYSPRADSLFRSYAKQRMKLFPYIYSYALRSRLEARPLLGKFDKHIYQFTFGDEMLLAPVFEKNARTWNVYLPAGTWTNYWTGTMLQGDSSYTVEAPISQIPLFIRAGAIIPMRNYAPSIEKGNNDTLTLQIYDGSGSFHLLEDDGTSNDYLKSGFASTLIETRRNGNYQAIDIHPVSGKFNGMQKARAWILELRQRPRPGTVKLNSRLIPFTYDEKSRTVTIPCGTLPLSRSVHVTVRYDR